MRKISLLFFLLPFLLSAQKLEYKLLIHGDEVGNLIAEHLHTESHDIYEVHSQGSVKILFTISSRYYSFSKLRNNELLYSKSILYKNEHLSDTVVVKKIKSKYYSETGMKTHKTQIIGNITYVANMLYFKEPVGVKKVFSEKKGYFVDLVAKPDHKYLLIDSKMNTENTYIYKNGKLVKAILDGGIVNFELELKP